jgi:hypothetical protein
VEQQADTRASQRKFSPTRLQGKQSTNINETKKKAWRKSVETLGEQKTKTQNIKNENK